MQVVLLVHQKTGGGQSVGALARQFASVPYGVFPAGTESPEVQVVSFTHQ